MPDLTILCPACGLEALEPDETAEGDEVVEELCPDCAADPEAAEEAEAESA